MAAKNLCVTYILWLIGGWLGLHHYYLGRDRHGLIWFFTAGGCFGLGWLRDLCRIPDYVDDANSTLKKPWHDRPYPKFNFVRFVGEVIVGVLFGSLFRSLIPERNLEEYILLGKVLDLTVPLVVAIGVHFVVNVGHELGSLGIATFGSYMSLPVYLTDPSHIVYTAFTSAILVNWKGKQWKKGHRKRGFCKRALLISICTTLYTLAWLWVLFNNVSVTTEDGEKILLRDALGNFLESPAWMEMKKTFWKFYVDVQEDGWDKAYEKLVEKIDPEGEASAYKTLGLSSNATAKDVNSAYRDLVKIWHPDKVKDASMKEEAGEKFMQIQKAYETLSSIKARRSKKNMRKPSDEL